MTQGPPPAGHDRPGPDDDTSSAPRHATPLDDRIDPPAGAADFGLVLDESLRILECPDAFAARLGHPDAAALRGRPLAETLDPASATKLQRLPARLADGHPLVVELNHRATDGRALLARYYLFPPGTFGPAKTHLVALGSDRQSEMGLLEEMIDLKRQREVQLARSREQGRRLEHRNQDLRTISHMIHHEVNNALNAIGLTAALVERQALSFPEASRRGAADIHQLCQHLGGILKGFVALANLSQDQAPTPERVDLHEAVRAALHLAATARPGVRHRARLRLDVDHAWAHPAHVRQILENLLTNAFKYRDPAKPELHLGLLSRRDGGQIRISVLDNGLGIPENRQANIFELFTRAHGGEGRGVGLAIVKRLAEVNGGAVALRSCPGRGSAFRITLPAPSD